MGDFTQYRGAVYILKRNTKEKRITSKRAFVGVAILDRIVALFFLTKFEAYSQSKTRAPPTPI